MKDGYNECSCGLTKRVVASRCRECYSRSRRIGNDGNSKFSKTCPFCGKGFTAYDSRLVYCSKECSDNNLRVIRRGEGNPNWNPESASSENGRQRAQRWYDLRPCEVCGSEKSERHHRDGDSYNNAHENIMFLCRRHHMIEDGRMERLLALNASRSKTA